MEQPGCTNARALQFLLQKIKLYLARGVPKHVAAGLDTVSQLSQDILTGGPETVGSDVELLFRDLAMPFRF